MPKLHANGRKTLHIDDATYQADEEGMFDVDAAHHELAIAHGATVHDPAVQLRAPSTDDHAERIATLENTVSGYASRIVALEGLVRELTAKAKK